jgi:hypothetical protein
MLSHFKSLHQNRTNLDSAIQGFKKVLRHGLQPSTLRDWAVTANSIKGLRAGQRLKTSPKPIAGALHWATIAKYGSGLHRGLVRQRLAYCPKARPYTTVHQQAMIPLSTAICLHTTPGAPLQFYHMLVSACSSHASPGLLGWHGICCWFPCPAANPRADSHSP